MLGRYDTIQKGTDRKTRTWYSTVLKKANLNKNHDPRVQSESKKRTTYVCMHAIGHRGLTTRKPHQHCPTVQELNSHQILAIHSENNQANMINLVNEEI